MDTKAKLTPLEDMKRELSRQICAGCGIEIVDKFLLHVSSGFYWHAQCLRCSACNILLEENSFCYLKNTEVFCRSDYQRLFLTKCSKCARCISATDWVRKAKDQVYHLACFACDACKRQLSTGEEFALCDEKVLCKMHFQDMYEGNASSNEDSCDGESSGSCKSKTKRVRTTFTDDQLRVLQANFQIDSNPDGQDLEKIALITGLSKRVTQVWFQNSRARQKKHMAKAKKVYHHHHSHQDSSSGSLEKTSAASQLSDSDSASVASPLQMLYTFS